MKRLMVLLIMTLMFCVSTASAASVKCEVIEVEAKSIGVTGTGIVAGSTHQIVTLECKESDIKEGDKVKVRLPKKGAIEGC